MRKMNKKERDNLHDISCVLFPHVKENEEIKKKTSILESDGWEYNPMDCCYTKGETRLSREYVFSSSLKELMQILRHISGPPDDDHDHTPTP